MSVRLAAPVRAVARCLSFAARGLSSACLLLVASAAPAQGIDTPPLPAPAHPPALSVSIQTDRSFVDWWPVLTNRDQVAWDELGSAIPCPTDDLDCPAFSNPGDDLRRVAWTYDASNISFYVERQNNPGASRGLFLSFDENLDGLLDGNERVVQVTWQPGGLVTLQRVAYVPRNAGGDPIREMGLHDGHQMNGTMALNPPIGSALSCMTCGSVDGLVAEFSIPWSWLNSGGPRAFDVKVSSSEDMTGQAQALPSDMYDNTGILALSRAVQAEATNGPIVAAPGSTVTAEFRVTQLGNRAGRFELRGHSEQGLPVRILRDGAGGPLLGVDGNGDADFDDPNDSVDADGSGDGLPDTGVTVPVGSFRGVGLEITIPSGAVGFVDRLELLVHPEGAPERVERATVAVHSGPLALSTDSWLPTPPGQQADHRHEVVNQSGAALLVEFDSSSAWPWSVADDDGGGNPGALLSDSDGDMRPELMLAAGETRAVHLLIDVPPGEMPGASVDAAEFLVAPDGVLEEAARVNAVTAVFDEITVRGEYGASSPGGPTPTVAGGLLWFAHEYVNASPDPAALFIFATNPGGSLPLTFTDPNGDGVPDDGQFVSSLDQIDVAPFDRFAFVTATSVPSGRPAGATEQVDTDVFNDTAGDGVIVFDEATVATGAVQRTPTYEVQTNAFAPCDDVHALLGTGSVGGPHATRWTGPGGPVRTQDRWTDLPLTLRDSRAHEPGDPAGAWTVTSNSRTAAWTLENDALVSLLRVESAAGGSALLPSQIVSNQQLVAALEGARVESSVLSSDATPGAAGGQILQWNGTSSELVAYDGAPGTVSHVRELRRLPAGSRFVNRFGLRGVSLPGGSYQLHSRLVASCGELLAESIDGFMVEVPVDTDGDTVVDSMDNCPTVANSDQMDDDSDLVGNACDNCPNTANTDQSDGDTDGVGDACDNCPAVSNSSQANSDGDSHGDACDNCVLDDNEDQMDRDTDLQGDACDPCPDDPTNACVQLDVLRNGDPDDLDFEQVALILDEMGDPAGAPRLDPVNDLFQPNVGMLSEVRIPGDADPVGLPPTPGILVYYEVTNWPGPLSVRKDGSDVVLSGW